MHGSILPYYRWASPIQESLKNSEKKTWLTIMYMSKWMDEWNILSTQEIDIDIHDKTPDIFHKFEVIWPSLLVQTLQGIISWNILWVPQDHTQASYCKKIEKEDGKIDFKNQNVFQIYNRFRAYFPWPWIYTFYKNKRLNIIDCFFEEISLSFDDDFCLWDVVEFENWEVASIWILCIWGILFLKTIKLEWKKEMNIKDFINGNKDFLEYNFLK
jgi:methionyl-tRNA formyltransferase